MVNLTLEEVKERLKLVDEVSLLEILNLGSDTLVEHFSDLIEDNLEAIIKTLEE
jgi:hypothetical protein